MTAPYSTTAAAQKAGISKRTLVRWVNSGKISPSERVPMNGRSLWRWTDADVEKVRAHKEANYRKGRGRKKAT